MSISLLIFAVLFYIISCIRVRQLHAVSMHLYLLLSMCCGVTACYGLSWWIIGGVVVFYVISFFMECYYYSIWLPQAALESEWVCYSTKMELIPTDPKNFIALDIEFYDNTTKELEALGFQKIGDYDMVPHSKAFPDRKCFFRYLKNTDNTVIAMLFHQRTLKPNDLFPKNFNYHSIVLFTEFEDHTFLQTANVSELNPIQEVEGEVCQWLPIDSSVNELIDAHETKIKIICEEKNLKPLQISTFTDLEQSCSREHELLLHDRLKKGGFTENELKDCYDKRILNSSKNQEMYIKSYRELAQKKLEEHTPPK